MGVCAVGGVSSFAVKYARYLLIDMHYEDGGQGFIRVTTEVMFQQRTEDEFNEPAIRLDLHRYGHAGEALTTFSTMLSYQIFLSDLIDRVGCGVAKGTSLYMDASTEIWMRLPAPASLVGQPTCGVKQLN